MAELAAVLGDELTTDRVTLLLEKLRGPQELRKVKDLLQVFFQKGNNPVYQNVGVMLLGLFIREVKYRPFF